MSKRSRIRALWAATGVVAAIVTVGSAAAATNGTHLAVQDPPKQAPSTSVAEWLTTPGSDTATTAQLPLQYGITPGPTLVEVDPNIKYQTVSGFGAAITDSAAHVLYGLDDSTRAQVMSNLFSPNTGAGISFLRQPIGASDFVADQDYSFDDMPPGQTDYSLNHFSIAHDEPQILPLLREARQLDPSLQIVATPWSPPGWMKTGDSMIDGKLIDSPAIYHTYAEYLVKFLQAYQAAGVRVDYLTVQNEPQALQRKNYPGTDLDWQQEAKVIDALGPMIRAAGLSTKILGYDHNWSEHPGDVKTHEQANEDPELNYPYDLLESNANRWIYGTAYHCYAGDPSAQTPLKASFPDKPIYMDECEGGDISTILGVMQNWGSSSIDWNIALNQNNGPHVGGCGSCNGTITINSQTEAVTYNDQYRDIEHFSKFVPNGSVHIGGTVADTSDNPLSAVAFLNPDHTTTVVAYNPDTTIRTFDIVDGSESFVATLAPGARATYQWHANR
jgi:glucosylceramidase